MSIPVSKLLNHSAIYLNLELICGKDYLSVRNISSYKIQKPSLALAGFVKHIHKDRIQILGETEISYLSSLDSDKRCGSIKNLLEQDVACLVVTKKLDIPYEVIKIAEIYKVPLFRTDLDTETAINNIQSFLESELAYFKVLHGTLLNMLGLGVLLIGRSGIGKSETALELVDKGHTLVADDMVKVFLKKGQLIGKANVDFLYYLELRGLGLINIRELFGIRAVMLEYKIDLVVEFKDWDKYADCERLGLDTKYYNIFEKKIPYIVLPVYPGRNMSVLIETAAKDLLLKKMGMNASKELSNKLLEKISKNRERLENKHKKDEQ